MSDKEKSVQFEGKGQKREKKECERKVKSLFIKESEVKKALLARKPTYFLYYHDVYLAIIARCLITIPQRNAINVYTFKNVSLWKHYLSPIPYFEKMGSNINSTLPRKHYRNIYF